MVMSIFCVHGLDRPSDVSRILSHVRYSLNWLSINNGVFSPGGTPYGSPTR